MFIQQHYEYVHSYGTRVTAFPATKHPDIIPYIHPFKKIISGQHCIDTQCHLSYTSTIKKQYLIKNKVSSAAG